MKNPQNFSMALITHLLTFTHLLISIQPDKSHVWISEQYFVLLTTDISTDDILLGASCHFYLSIEALCSQEIV